MPSRAVVQFRRTWLEQWIEHAIALLDQMDGDPDFEDGGDAEPEETDQNGDEQDTLHSEDDNCGGGRFAMGRIAGGCGL